MLPDQDFDRAQLSQSAGQLLEDALGQRRYRHWFHGKTRITADGDELIVRIGNPYLLNWIQKQFRTELSHVARTLLGAGARVRLDVDGSAVSEPAVGAQAKPKPSAARITAPQAPSKPQTSRHYADLRQFVCGACNELALAAARQVADAPGQKYNPLYIYGGVGSGKTHLLEGIYRKLHKDAPSLQVLLLTAENFGNFFSQALSAKSVAGFRQRFRNVDVLLLDDLDFLDGKKAFQEEFLHTVKKLEREGRQIVVAADRHPRLLTRSSDELVSRLLSGLVCRIEPPDLETRRGIVRQRAQALRLAADEAALNLVAERFTNNVRELIGALNCLQTYEGMTGRRVGASAARTVLSSLERDCLRIVRIADVEQAVCRLFRVTADELKSASRARSLTQPRMLAMYLARRLTQQPYSEIGRYFGRNHATVMSAERKIGRLVDGGGVIRVATEAWPVGDLVRSLEQQILAG
jgi:chromosomal replication initiator protein